MDNKFLKNKTPYDIANFFIGLFSLILSMISLVLSINFNSVIFCYIFKISILVFAFVMIINFIKNFFFHQYMIDGTFAVSAIVINDKEQFLFVDENIDNKVRLSQPSSYYRIKKRYTKRQFSKLENSKLLSPYDQIVKVIAKEAGISKASLELIDFSEYKFINKDLKKITVESLLSRDEYQNLNLKKFIYYDENEFSPAPFLIEKEVHGSQFSSRETIHIDFFYAFKITQYDSNNKNIKFYNYEEFLKMVNDETKNIYSDLVFVVDYFRSLYSNTKILEKEVKFCRINKNKNTIVWEVTNNCNQSCKFCINRNKLLTTRTEISQDVIDKILAEMELLLDVSKKYKLILTGGEPSLVENLMDIIEILNNINYINEISICTNGTNCLNFISNSDILKKKSKIVINVPAYDYDMYAKIVGSSNEEARKKYKALILFIKKLGEIEVQFRVITVMTNVFNNFDYVRDFIVFLKEHGIRDISFSYVVKSEQNIMNRNLFIEKMEDALKIYSDFVIGKYGDISFLKSCKLMLPNCENKYCNENNNIIFIKDNKVIRFCVHRENHLDS